MYGHHGEREDDINWEMGIDIYTLWILCIKYITNEKLQNSSGKPTECSVVT